MGVRRQPPAYHAWMLRCWRDAGAAPWRWGLEDPHTGARRGFASLTDLAAFLEGVVIREPSIQIAASAEPTPALGGDAVIPTQGRRAAGGCVEE
jgi:hypothetical protein